MTGRTGDVRRVVAQKISVVETAAALFRHRARNAGPGDLERIMNKMPDVSPTPEDAIPPDLVDRLAR